MEDLSPAEAPRRPEHRAVMLQLLLRGVAAGRDEMDLLRKGVAAAAKVDPEDVIVNHVMQRTSGPTGLEVVLKILTQSKAEAESIQWALRMVAQDRTLLDWVRRELPLATQVRVRDEPLVVPVAFGTEAAELMRQVRGLWGPSPLQICAMSLLQQLPHFHESDGAAQWCMERFTGSELLDAPRLAPQPVFDKICDMVQSAIMASTDSLSPYGAAKKACRAMQRGINSYGVRVEQPQPQQLVAAEKKEQSDADGSPGIAQEARAGDGVLSVAASQEKPQGVNSSPVVAAPAAASQHIVRQKSKGDKQLFADVCATYPNASFCTSNCCTPHFMSGCESAAVEECVCKHDPFCCKHEWDTICVQGVQAAGCASCAATEA